MNIKRWMAGLLALGTLGMPIASAEASTLDSIKVEEEAKQNELQALENEINQALNEINAIHSNLNNLAVEIEETEQSIEENQEDIAKKEKEVEKRNKVMKENLRGLQTSEMNHSLIISILNSENISEMFNRIQALTTLQSASNESFELAQNEYKELIALKEKNEAEKEKLENDKATVEAEEAALNKKVAQLNTKLEDNKEELEVLAERKQKEAARLREETEKIERMQALEAEEKETEVVQLTKAMENKDAEDTVVETMVDTSSKENSKPAKMNNPAPKPTEKKEEKAPQSKPAPKAEQPKQEPKPQKEANGRTMTVVATAYSTNQPSLSTHTATGIDLRSNPNVIAVDPNVIPLHSLVEIPGYGVYLAGDTGGAIKGNRIDIHITDLSTARSFGYQTLNVKILN